MLTAYHLDFHRSANIQVNIPLWERNNDSVLLEQLADAEAYRAADIPEKFLTAHIAPKVSIENKRAIAEILKHNARFGLLLYFCLFRYRLEY